MSFLTYPHKKLEFQQDIWLIIINVRPITALNRNSSLSAKGAMCVEMIAGQHVAILEWRNKKWRMNGKMLRLGG